MANCTTHTETPAAAECASCQQPFCQACLVPFEGHQVCGRCRDYRAAQYQQWQQTAPPGVVPPARASAVEQIIPARNPAALVGYYLGVFSLIPLLGNLLGPAAIVLGILGLGAVRRTPGLPGKAHAITAIVLGTLTTVVYWGLFVWGFAAAMWGR